MGILDSDIGYQIGLLAGGLWAERYRQRGEEKRLAEEKAPLAIEAPNYQNSTADLTIGNLSPAIMSPNYPYIQHDHTISIAPYQNTAPYNPTAKPYTIRTSLLNNRYRPFQK